MTVKIDGTNTVANPAFTGADTDTGLQCGTNEVKLVTGGSERATVDSSGNVLVGKTSSSGLNAGCEFRPAGMGLFTRASANPLQVRRLTDDGDLVELYKDSILRGSVGVSGTALTVGVAGTERLRIFANGSTTFTTNSTDTNVTDVTQLVLKNSSNAANTMAGIRFEASSNSNTDHYIIQKKHGAGTGTDLIIQQGNSERVRFHESGGITFHGDTAATNALDDYEEGDWTPSSYQNFNGVSNADGEYTKIGNFVTVQFQFNYSSLGASGQSSAINGLPFTVANVNPNTGVEATSIAFGTNKDVTVWAEGGTNRLYFRTGSPAVGSQSTGADFFRGSISYMAS